MLNIILSGALLIVGAHSFDLSRKNRELRLQIEKLYEIIKMQQGQIERIQGQIDQLRIWKFREKRELQGQIADLTRDKAVLESVLDNKIQQIISLAS